MVPRLRSAQVLASSDRGDAFHATLGPFFSRFLHNISKHHLLAYAKSMAVATFPGPGPQLHLGRRGDRGVDVLADFVVLALREVLILGPGQQFAPMALHVEVVAESIYS